MTRFAFVAALKELENRKWLLDNGLVEIFQAGSTAQSRKDNAVELIEVSPAGCSG